MNSNSHILGTFKKVWEVINSFKDKEYEHIGKRVKNS